jgi:hypothetical protein
VALTSCSGSGKDKTIWEQVKINDLAPSRAGSQPGNQSLKTMNFSVYTFEIPAENISVLNNIWQMLDTKPLRFNNHTAFTANSFSIGLGQLQIWNKIADLLLNAGGKRIDTTLLLLPDDQPENVTISRLTDKQTVFYLSGIGSTEKTAIGPGTIVLRIKPEKVPAQKGVCEMSVLPVFVSVSKMSEFHFDPLGFSVEMSPGDFVFLGPERYITHQITLAGLFFRSPAEKPTTRCYLIVCTAIND